MDESGINPKDHFIKQRRNIAVISATVWLYVLGDVSFRSTATVMGNDIIIGNPEVVEYFLYTLLLYFSWRYITACGDLKGLKEFIYNIDARMEKKDENILKRRLDKDLSGENAENCEYKLYKRDGLKRFYSVFYSVKINTDQYLRSEKEYIIGNERIWRWPISFLNALFFKTSFNEYVLPYLIMLSAMIACLLNHFEYL